jgi:hypothetical protein
VETEAEFPHVVQEAKKESKLTSPFTSGRKHEIPHRAHILSKDIN